MVKVVRHMVRVRGIGKIQRMARVAVHRRTRVTLVMTFLAVNGGVGTFQREVSQVVVECCGPPR